MARIIRASAVNAACERRRGVSNRFFDGTGPHSSVDAVRCMDSRSKHQHPVSLSAVSAVQRGELEVSRSVRSIVTSVAVMGLTRETIGTATHLQVGLVGLAGVRYIQAPARTDTAKRAGDVSHSQHRVCFRMLSRPHVQFANTVGGTTDTDNSRRDSVST